MTGGATTKAKDVWTAEAAGFRHRLRTRLVAVMALAGALLLAGGGVGLYYVDEIATTLHRSTDVTSPLLSDLLELTQTGRRVRTSVRAAAEQCVGVEAARADLGGFGAALDGLVGGLRPRAALVGAVADLDRVAAIEARFATVGQDILASCLRNGMIADRIVVLGEGIDADVADMTTVLDRIDARLIRGAAPADGTDEGADPFSGAKYPSPAAIARLHADLGGFRNLADLVSSYAGASSIDAFRRRRVDKLREVAAEVAELRLSLGPLGLDLQDRLTDRLTSLAEAAVGDRGIFVAQAALTSARADLADLRGELNAIDDDYFRAVRRLEATARLLDESAHGAVVRSTEEAYGAVALTSLTLLLLVLVIAGDTARRVTGPIERFTEHVHGLSGLEDLDRPLPLALAERRDEIGLLARAFRTLTGELAAARRRLETEAETQIRRQYDRLQAAIATMPQGFFLVDAEERLVVWNDSFLEMYAFRPGEVAVGMPIEIVLERRRAIGACEAQPQEPLFRLAVAEGRPHQRIETYVDGRIMVITASPTADGGAAITHEDVTARKRTEAELEQLARYDAVTGLANRAHFHERLVEALAADAAHRRVALFYVDLDHFKTINEALGHSTGDRLLAVVAERIVEAVGGWETVGRLGGDEFAVLKTLGDRPAEAAELARRLHDAISRPYELDGARVVVGASIGVAMAPDDAADPDALLAHADMALFRAKSEGRGVTRFFERSMDADLQRRRTLELDLGEALERGEFELHYQPVVGAASGRIEAFEALLRWRHPTRGLVSPADFIPLAEETGLIGEIGAWVLREATRVAAGWPKDLRVAVNISPVQIRTRALMLDVLAAIGRSGLPPDRLELEITEGVLLVDTEATLATLAQLREFGVRIAMDDFGTGYSSLGYLRRFAFDKVKIDQSFVRDLDETPDAVAIVRAVTSLCSSLGITTTAEGVETEAQRDRLLQEGCDQFQGWLYGRPMPACAVAAHLASEAAKSRAVATAESGTLPSERCA
ncbi:MAG: EAL domain-containing protein [Hyphomicrobiales bacterium]|nr:EAL domain-containing protein [Hyphomicrobiales bacterium]